MTEPKPLTELDQSSCRWPVNDAGQGEVHLFCVAPAAEGKPYCPDHCRLAYVPKGKSRD